MLDFRMYTFITLSQTLNYTKAAKQLCMTQPAVTQHIKHLESYYQVKLFQSVNKQLRLTSAGLILQKHMMTMAADEIKLKDMITNTKDTLEHIRFGATRTIGEFVLPEKLEHVIQANPNTSITMIVENTSILIHMLKRGEIDFAFIEGYFTKSDLLYHPISKEPYIAVKAKNMELHASTITMKDLCSQTLIIREKGSGTREILERILNEQNMHTSDFQNLIEIGNIHAIKDLVKKGYGITFIYKAAVEKELEEGSLEIIDIEDLHITHEFNFISLQDSIFSESYKTFLNIILNE